MYSITDDEIESFRRNHYIHLKNFFSTDVVCLIKDISDGLSLQASSILKKAREENVSLADRAKTTPFDLIVVPEAEKPMQVCRYEFMIGCSSLFKSFVASNLQDSVSALAGCKVVPFKDKTNEKLPGGGGFRPHQDFAAYGLFTPRYHLTALLSIHPATPLNGCVQFATNFEDLIRERTECVAVVIGGQSLLHYDLSGPTNGDIRANIAAEFRWQSITSTPADLVIFDSFVPHCSQSNRSDGPRRAIFVTFNSASEGFLYDQYYSEKRMNYKHPKFHMSTPTSFEGVLLDDPECL